MGRIGPGEIILVVLVIVLLFGAKKLPELGSAIGEFLKRFRKASQDIEDDIKKSVEDSSHEKKS